jgi:hypothetical protein
VKRSGRDESILVIIHMCVETTQGISSIAIPIFKLAKMLCLFYYCLCLLFNKIPGSEGDGREREGAGGRWEKWPKQCMHM